MLPNCKKSCKQCSKCEDQNMHCSYWAKSGECRKNPDYMISNCKKSCNKCDVKTDDSDAPERKFSFGFFYSVAIHFSCSTRFLLLLLLLLKTNEGWQRHCAAIQLFVVRCSTLVSTMALVRACVSLLLIALFYNYATVQVSADSAIDEVILDAANSNRDFQDSSHEVVETDEQRQALQRLSQSGESQREKKQVAGHRFRRWLHGGISFGLQIHNCLDQNEQCPYWAGIGECGKDHNYMYTNCKKSCKVCDSQPPNPAIFELPNPVVIEPPNPAVFELPNPVVIEPPNPVVFGHCLDQNEDCAFLATIGECDKNPSYMYTNCKKSCNMCPFNTHVPGVSENCLDQNEKCSYWAFIGECAKNPIYMHSNCKKSCWLCGSTNSDLVGFEHCLDQNEKCSHWANNGECDKNPIYMHSYCKNSCQLCDSQPLNPGVVEPCIDNNAKCAHWAKSGECDINPVYMLTNCKSSCSACKLN
eukprot:XP_014773035.1 PREDICTED: uncharacterized protein LOC106871202 [Octopus bimaculoides]